VIFIASPSQSCDSVIGRESAFGHVRVRDGRWSRR
jgi:hypothetical protein